MQSMKVGSACPRTARMPQSKLTDSVIDDAVAAMPEPFARDNGRELRGHSGPGATTCPTPLPSFTLLADDVDFQGTDRRNLTTRWRRRAG
jgi:hypothetical protein